MPDELYYNEMGEELIPLAEKPIKVKITLDDFRQFRTIYRSIAPERAKAICEVIKQRSAAADPNIDSAISILALFVKYTRNPIRDRKLIKTVFGLNNQDISYLICRVHENELTEVTVTRQKAVSNTEQPDLPFDFSDDMSAKPETQKVIFEVETKPETEKDFIEKKITEATAQGKTDQQEKTKTAIFKKAFIPMLTNEGINAFHGLSKRKVVEESQVIDGENYVVLSRPKTDTRRPEEFKFLLKEYENFRGTLTTSTLKLLDVILSIFTNQNYCGQKTSINPFVKIRISDYMKAQGRIVNNMNIAKYESEILKDISILQNGYLSWKRGGKIGIPTNHSGAKIGILSDRYVKGTTKDGEFDVFIQVSVSPVLSHCLLLERGKYFIMQYPTGLLKIPNTKPTPYKIGFLLTVHYSNTTNQEKDRHNILSVKNILESTDLPRLDEIQNREYRKQIITPFINAMQELENAIGLQWNFCNSKKTALRSNQKPERNIDDFLSCYIHFELPEMPMKKQITKGKKRR